MRKLDLNKSTGPDQIGNLILKACHETLSKSLTFIFRRCINKGIFPSIWKTSQVTPIFKEGNKADVSCYKPISSLYCCSKILEKVIFDALYSKVKDKLHDSQFGFRKRLSSSSSTIKNQYKTWRSYI